MSPPSLNDITKLLVSTHTADELRFLVRDIAEEVADTLPEGKGVRVVAERVAEGVIHRGLQDALRDRLLIDRPGRAHDIGVLFGRAADSRKVAMTEAVDNALRDVEDPGEPRSLESYLQEAREDQEDLLYETFRSMAFSKSRAAWPYIARMTADYLKNRGGKPDTFFKRMAWLLERCEDEDVHFIARALVLTRECVNEATGEAEDPVVEWTHGGGGALTVSARRGRGVSASVRVVAGEFPRNYEVNGLVRESRIGRSSGGRNTRFPPEEGFIKQLIRLFLG